jgi:3-oxoacyl-[acyl-carrier protein] reductase
MTPPDLSQRTAIVTGAAGGLGRAMAAALARAGSHVVLVDLDPARLAAALAIFRIQFGAKAQSFVADISNPSQAQAAVDFAKGLTGCLDILVNNAAIGPTVLEQSAESKSLKFWESDEKLWRRSVDVNVNGTFLMARCAAPALIENGWGRIINISTSLSTMQRAATSPYGVTKAAIEAETQIWARDLEGTYVTVNTLLPGGAVDTDFVSAGTRVAASKGKVKLLAPEVMVQPLLYLASQYSDGVTGCRFVASRWDASKDLDVAQMGAREAAFAGA